MCYIVEVVYDGEEVEYLIVFGEYVVIVFDLLLLYVDGMMVFKCICCKGNCMLVIILIVNVLLDGCVVGLDFGVDDYFVKFFELVEFEVWLCVVICCGYDFVSLEIVIVDFVFDSVSR